VWLRIARWAEDVLHAEHLSGSCYTYQSPPESVRAVLALFPAAAEANEVGAIV
jgi:hypothetical protein